MGRCARLSQALSNLAARLALAPRTSFSDHVDDGGISLDFEEFRPSTLWSARRACLSPRCRIFWPRCLVARATGYALTSFVIASPEARADNDRKDYWD